MCENLEVFGKDLKNIMDEVYVCFFATPKFTENAGMSTLLRKIYASVHAFLIILQYLCMMANMAQYSDEVNELTANTITVLFFAHSIIKLIFFAINSKSFYR